MSMTIINFNDSTVCRLKSEVIRVRGVRSLDTSKSDAFAEGISYPSDESFGLDKKMLPLRKFVHQLLVDMGVDQLRQIDRGQPMTMDRVGCANQRCAGR